MGMGFSLCPALWQLPSISARWLLAHTYKKWLGADNRIVSDLVFFVYTIIFMTFDFDPAKNVKNLAKHGVSLLEADHFEWETAAIREDTRKAYAEQRFEATGLIGERLFVMVY